MKNWLAAVGSNASYKSVASSIGQAVNTGAAAVKAAVKEERTATQPDRHHVRLSLESAKRLRWIESEDVSALVRRHAQEKNLMGECVSAMRKFLLQKGFQEEEMDAEVQALLNEAREIDINDQDVATVLLVSVQDELNDLRSRLAAFESRQPSTSTPLTTSMHAHGSYPFHPQPDVHSTGVNETHVATTNGAASSSSASYTTLPMPPTPPDASAAGVVGAPSGHAAWTQQSISPRFSRQDSNTPAVQLLLTVQPSDDVYGSNEVVRCTIAPVAPRKVPEYSVPRTQSSVPPQYNTIAQQAAHLQDLLAQQNSIYSELLALKPAIMSARIAANSNALPVSIDAPPATPFTLTSTPGAPDMLRSPAEAAVAAAKSEVGETELYSSWASTNLSLSFPTTAAAASSENNFGGSYPSNLASSYTAVASPTKSSSSLQKAPLQTHDKAALSPSGEAGGTQVATGAPPAPPPRLELSKAMSVDSGKGSELQFGSPRSCAQATADLQPMLMHLFKSMNVASKSPKRMAERSTLGGRYLSISQRV